MGWIDIKNIRMANMQCDITELIEKLSDEARLYLLKRMASRNLSLRQVLLEIAIAISREGTSIPERSAVVHPLQSASR